MTPSAGTQGTEMTQRMVFPIFTQSEGRLLILAPPDASILLQGYHMLFLLNGDTPSEAKWIRFSDLSQPSANPTLSPFRQLRTCIGNGFVWRASITIPCQTNSTYAKYVTTTIANCESQCESDVGCDFYTFNTLTQACHLKYADNIANTSTFFKGKYSSDSCNSRIP